VGNVILVNLLSWRKRSLNFILFLIDLVYNPEKPIIMGKIRIQRCVQKTNAIPFKRQWLMNYNG